MVVAASGVTDDLVVGSFGHGKIKVYSSCETCLAADDIGGNPIVIDGLWNIGFGNLRNGRFATLFRSWNQQRGRRIVWPSQRSFRAPAHSLRREADL